jgi:ABC-type phosphate transport system substrate-binding protein
MDSAIAEDIVVVMNLKSGVESLNRDDVIDIFMGRNRQLSTGETALPLDLPNSAIEREYFYSRLTNKSKSEINAYWARLIFTGRATPPTLLHSQDETIQMVIKNRNSVGYLGKSKLDPRLKVVFELKEK